MITKQKKEEIKKKFARHEKDTGSPELQIALLTERIRDLTENHFKKHVKDHHSKRGLLKLVSKRKKLLAYLQRTDYERYKTLLQELNLRK
ncbi:MAG: 30S ribosomal protein S15 [Leptonema sp. (in: bacteria)]